MSESEVFVDTFEPNSWADTFSTHRSDENIGLKHNLKSMGYEGDILIRQEEVTWGIERKTFTDALNSWMGKRLIRQISDLAGKVTHPILLVIEEPEKRLSNSANNPYRKFSKHIPNLESHLNRISMEICPVIRARDEPTAMREVAKLIERINKGKFSTINLQNHQINHVNPVIQLLQNIPRIGAQRARKIYSNYDNFQDFIKDENQELKGLLTKKDYETVSKFLKDNWVSEN